MSPSPKLVKSTNTTRIKQMEEELAALKITLETTRLSLKDMQKQCLYKDMKIRNLQLPVNQFVQVLIDGDDSPFLDRFIRNGGVGGADAACRLREEVESYMEELYPGLQLLIMVNMYVGLAGQARLYAEHGVSKEVLHHFVGEFNALAHFEIIDVGRGKERADYKLARKFDFCLRNRQCKHIIIAGLHDRGYVNVLREAKGCKGKGRITLLKTTTVREGFERLGFEIKTFGTVFKAQAIEKKVSPSASPSPSPFLSPPPALNKARRLSSSLSPSAPRVVRPLQENMPPPLESSMLASRTPKQPFSISGKGSYASVATGDSSQLKTSFDIARSKSEHSILVNAANERLDKKLEPCDPNDKSFVFGFEPRRLCNEYYLNGYCSAQYYASRCPFEHDIPLKPGHLLALRHVARDNLCKNGHGCDKINCLYGHVCPYELKHGSGECEKSENCKFYKVHGKDLVSAPPGLWLLIRN